MNEHNHFSDTNWNRPQHSVEINSLMNGTRRLMFALEIKIKYLFVESFLSLVSLMRGFCPRGLCSEMAYV